MRDTEHEVTSSEAFKKHKAEIKTKIGYITEKLNAIKEDDVNWAQVGSTCHINEILDELIAFYVAK